ncbi:hypothetical protein Pcinc_043043 [Petrolisthes cinctipes]|uniref:Uncharacterized protein n=1 Tax=Petrolisthes cinctipes TaxID=88211 RepID=A0AAE1EGF9_PETCI|nr:hypothetical protein Pcinc_043043 [Petrolisthes cinctipes]
MTTSHPHADADDQSLYTTKAGFTWPRLPSPHHLALETLQLIPPLPFLPYLSNSSLPFPSCLTSPTHPSPSLLALLLLWLDLPPPPLPVPHRSSSTRAGIYHSLGVLVVDSYLPHLLIESSSCSPHTRATHATNTTKATATHDSTTNTNVTIFDDTTTTQDLFY